MSQQKNGKIYRSIAQVLSGSVLAQIIAIAATPILTRLFSPEAFGELAIYIAVSSILVTLYTLKYEAAIPATEHDEDAHALAGIAHLALTFACLLTLLLSLVTAGAPMRLLNVPDPMSFGIYLSLGIFFLGAFRIVRSTAVRSNQFAILAQSSVSYTGLSILFQLIGGMLMGAVTLVPAQIAGRAVTVGGAIARLHDAHRLWSLPKLDQLKKTAIDYRKYPIYTMPAAFMSVAGSQAPNVILAIAYGISTSGIYLIVQRVLAAPVKLVSESVGQVFYGHARKKHDSGELSSFALDIYYKLALLGAIPTVIIVASGPWLFDRVFGEQWAMAGQFAQWLVIAMYFNFCITPISRVLLVLGKEKLEFKLQTVMTVIKISSLCFGALFLNATETIMLFSASSALGYIIYTAMVFRSLGTTIAKLLPVMLFPLLCVVAVRLLGG